MIDIDQMKRHCESVREDTYGTRIVCFRAEKVMALIERVEVAEQDAAVWRWAREQPNLTLCYVNRTGAEIEADVRRMMAAERVNDQASAAGAGQNIGNGHVFPRPDGVRARCGGPPICRECARDLARKQALPEVKP